MVARLLDGEKCVCDLTDALETGQSRRLSSQGGECGAGDRSSVRGLGLLARDAFVETEEKEIRRARTTMTFIQLSIYPFLAMLVAGWFQLLTTGSSAGAIGVLIGSAGLVGTAWRTAIKWAVRA